MKFILILSLLFNFVVVSQTDKFIYPVNCDFNDTLYEDFNKFESVFESKKLVGVGESIHGVSEFAKMRFRLFKYLVKEHSFNTLFLEMDFANASMIQRYINGKITLGKAMQWVDSWPFKTFEFVEFIKFIKRHNLQDSSKQIVVYGIESNRVNTSIEVLNHLSKEILDTIIFDEQVSQKTYKDFLKMDSVEILNFTEKVKLAEVRFFQMKMCFSDSCEFRNLYNSLFQGIESLYSTGLNKSLSRNRLMAVNIIDYLSISSERKGLIWAHNGHLANFTSSNKQEDFFLSSAGVFLKNKYDNEFVIIGQEASEGRFLAATKVNGEFKGKRFTLTNKGRNSLQKKLHKYNVGALFIKSSEIKNIEKLKLTSIGAVHHSTSTRYIIGMTDKFDYFLYQTVVTPSNLY